MINLQLYIKTSKTNEEIKALAKQHILDNILRTQSTYFYSKTTDQSVDFENVKIFETSKELKENKEAVKVGDIVLIQKIEIEDTETKEKKKEPLNLLALIVQTTPEIETLTIYSTSEWPEKWYELTTGTHKGKRPLNKTEIKQEVQKFYTETDPSTYAVRVTILETLKEYIIFDEKHAKKENLNDIYELGATPVTPTEVSG